MINELNISEKRVIFYILSQIMKADNILNPAEITFLEICHLTSCARSIEFFRLKQKNMPICFLYAWQNVTDMWIQGNLR